VAKISRILLLKLNQLVYKNVHIITILLSMVSDTTITNILQSLPHIMAGIDMVRNYVTVILSIFHTHGL